jgi:hypothetical protein
MGTAMGRKEEIGFTKALRGPPIEAKGNSGLTELKAEVKKSVFGQTKN